jgi:hypothetical protein
MATEAARLKRKNLLGGKTQTDLTLTGLLMEGLGSAALPGYLQGRAPTDSFLFVGIYPKWGLAT